MRQFCMQCLSKRPFKKFFNVFWPVLARYAGMASPLPCHGFFCESNIKVRALKAHCVVRCVASFVSRSLYTWTALHLFLIHFVVWVY